MHIGGVYKFYVRFKDSECNETISCDCVKLI